MSTRAALLRYGRDYGDLVPFRRRHRTLEEEGALALSNAARRGRTDAVKALLREPSFDPGRTVDRGRNVRSALHHSVGSHSNHDTRMALLPAPGEAPRPGTEYNPRLPVDRPMLDGQIGDPLPNAGNTPLHQAVEKGNVSGVEDFTQPHLINPRGPIRIDIENAHRQTALALARAWVRRTDTPDRRRIVELMEEATALRMRLRDDSETADDLPLYEARPGPRPVQGAHVPPNAQDDDIQPAPPRYADA